MINEIRTAFKDALDNLSWMDEQTRQAAKDKVREHCPSQMRQSPEKSAALLESVDVWLLLCIVKP